MLGLIIRAARSANKIELGQHPGINCYPLASYANGDSGIPGRQACLRRPRHDLPHDSQRLTFRGQALYLLQRANRLIQILTARVQVPELSFSAAG